VEHYALASVHLFNRRFDDCIAEFELALRLNPSFLPARGLDGVALTYRGRWEEGNSAATRGTEFACGITCKFRYWGRKRRTQLADLAYYHRFGGVALRIAVSRRPFPHPVPSRSPLAWRARWRFEKSKKPP
jgi:hypothetical protein